MTFEKQKHKTTTTSACDRYCSEVINDTLLGQDRVSEAVKEEICRKSGIVGTAPICMYNQKTGTCVATSFTKAADSEEAKDQCESML